MVVFKHFTLLGKDGEERKLKINEDDGNEVYLWRAKGNCGLLKNPYWKRCAKDEARGYFRIFVGKRYQLHRVCYYAHNPDWDIYDTSRDNQIDHIDRNKSNNHISNLRQATNSQNMENRNGKGYCYCNTHKRWFAHVQKDGKTYRKYCNTEEEAIETRRQLKEKYHTF